MNPANLILLAQENPDAASGAIGTAVSLIQLALAVATIAGLWKCFVKAGKPGWAAIIPIYNAVVLVEIAGKPVWWVLLLLIPCVNIVIMILVMIDFARAFGKGPVYGIGLALLGFIFFPLLGFGDARYLGSPQPQFK